MLIIDDDFKKLELPSKPGERFAAGGFFGSSMALMLANIAILQKGLTLAVVPDPLMASKLERELQFFLKNYEETIPVLNFPDWETLPYDSFSPHQDIISERLMTLYRLPHLIKGILVVPITTLMQRLCPKSYLLQNSVWLRKGQSFQITHVRKRLEEAGYRCVSQVLEHGEFAVRGSVFDLFPMGSDCPFRIDLFDNEIDSIRTFEVETQRSLEKMDSIQLLPAREFPMTEESIATFRTRFRSEFEGNPAQCSIYQDVSDGHVSPGLEYYLPLFFEKTSNLFEYLPDNSLMVLVEDIEKSAIGFWEHVKERYDQYSHDRLRPLLDPKNLFFQSNEVFYAIKQFPKIELTKNELESKKSFYDFSVSTLPSIYIDIKREKPSEALEEFLSSFKGKVLFCAESAGRREILKELLMKINCQPVEIDGWQQLRQLDYPYAITIAPLEEGQIMFDGSLAFITESELLGKRVMQRRMRKLRKPIMDMEIQNLAELTIGGPVVHIEHGVGRYLGLSKLSLSQQEAEFVTLEYAGGDKLYVPVSSLHLISRYSGADLEHAPLHRLGSEQWQRAKRKAIEQARDVAAELLEIYAKRAAKKGFAFPKPDQQYDSFCAGFPFEETPDQHKAIEEVLGNLTSDKPMDRVVCGDVGFGKTEVALRAAFLVAVSGKQVGVLVPTTLLADQHYQTFSDRFSEFPIKVEVISRFRTRKEQDEICKKLKEGKIDVLIGTHKILRDNVQFKSLGLLIIDEEHRFGVRQKEAFKAFRSEIDILTLTATPIPRTLNMAMSGLRDLSIIATPPAKRLSVKTFVRERNSALINEAILRELHRGGQVYFLHNEVESIEREAKFLQELIPTARIAVAHGQMRERELEQIMSDFYHRRYNVLVCTTIIETGIDIPTANTIIIDRSDKFGLAQLHQLRGRVGRSHHQAYAFCFIPPKVKLGSDALKRLEALATMEELGSGFTLATQDLEIRGAGELLGESQSGNIQSIGFSLYMEVLEEAVKTLKSGKELDFELSFKKGVEIDLQIPAFIPESFIPDVHSRLVLYKRISNCRQSDALEDLSVEIIDRFGLLPPQAQNLFRIAHLKLKAAKIGISKVEAGPKGGRLEFISEPNIDPAKIIKLVQNNPTLYRLEGPLKFRFSIDLSTPDLRVQKITELMAFLQ